MHHKIQIQIASSLKVATICCFFSVYLYVSGAGVELIFLSYVKYYLSGKAYKHHINFYDA